MAVIPNQPEGEENPSVRKRRRKISYDTPLFQSVAVYNDSLGQKEIHTNEIPHSWSREMTEAEFVQLVGNGAMAEVWLAAYYNNILGGNFCEVVIIE